MENGNKGKQVTVLVGGVEKKMDIIGGGMRRVNSKGPDGTQQAGLCYGFPAHKEQGLAGAVILKDCHGGSILATPAQIFAAVVELLAHKYEVVAKAKAQRATIGRRLRSFLRGNGAARSAH